MSLFVGAGMPAPSGLAWYDLTEGPYMSPRPVRYLVTATTVAPEVDEPRVVASGDRSVAVGANSGTIITGS